ncbi:hypothetical protein O181_130028 [Austropuccinia psidii MF-1]|uniref:Uncharacterized protein n=1 Tax=Austropuccinia psidii MF-1 TaxID=1389203 RepID=A0A9Q3Q9D3_9BASI|nr:hypothetical protein [Austropuccinia psidii MF-1]
MPKAPLDSTPTVPQLRAHLDREPIMVGEAPSRKEVRGPRRTTLKGLGEYDADEEENSVEEKGSSGTEASPVSVGKSSGTGGPIIAQSNQPETSLLAIMQQMTQMMANLQESIRPPAFITPSMEAPDYLYWTQPFKFRSFIQSIQLIFHNYRANLSEDKKKVLYATSFLTGRVSQGLFEVKRAWHSVNWDSLMEGSKIR